MYDTSSLLAKPFQYQLVYFFALLHFLVLLPRSLAGSMKNVSWGAKKKDVA
jgi:hypothetical protein